MAANPYGWASPGYSGDPGPGDFSYQRQGFDPLRQAPGNPFSSWLMDPKAYKDADSAGALSQYSQSALRPFLDFYLQNNAQDYQYKSDLAKLAEQRWLNQRQNDLAYRASGREDLAMQRDEFRNNRDYGENVRRYDLDRRFGYDQLGFQRDRDMGRLGLDRELGMAGIRQGDQRLNLDREMGMGRLDLDREMGRGQLGLGRDSLALERELGTGRLGLDTRRFEADDSFRYRDLQQQADLTRERLANEMTQSRYAAFGKRAAPNFNMMNSWR